MNFKNVISQLNIVGQCRRYGLSLWQCPQFIFLIMGIIIILSSLFIYAVGSNYITDPQIVALIVIVISSVLLVLSTVISRSFERLAEANRMKTEFVSIVSHQLRSPLSNLKWATEILLSGRISEVSDRQLEYFQILRENGDRMEELVSDLLVVSRIEQGKFAPRKENVSLIDLVEKSVKDSEIFAKASNVEIEFKKEENIPQISIDPSQIKLIIDNLLDNAIRYTKEKGVVEVRIEKKGRDLYFGVKDNGVGIPARDQKYIFQKFFRSTNALRHKTEGSGLGLYIAKSIIEKFGGKIGFKSQEGLGSTFWFVLPIK